MRLDDDARGVLSDVGDVHGDDGTCELLTLLVPVFVDGRSARIENGLERAIPVATGPTSLNELASCSPSRCDRSPCIECTRPRHGIAGTPRE